MIDISAGLTAYMQQNWQEAIKELKPAADEGVSSAQFMLGKSHFFLEEYISAVAEWRKAAEQGHPDAQHCLGHAYSCGFGVQMDAEIAQQWHDLAAQTR